MYNNNIADGCGLLVATVGMTSTGILGELAAVAAIIHCGVIVARGAVKLIKIVVAWKRGKITTDEALNAGDEALKEIETEVKNNAPKHN